MVFIPYTFALKCNIWLLFASFQAREGHFVCDGTGFRGVQHIIDEGNRRKKAQNWGEEIRQESILNSNDLLCTFLWTF